MIMMVPSNADDDMTMKRQIRTKITASTGLSCFFKFNTHWWCCGASHHLMCLTHTPTAHTQLRDRGRKHNKEVDKIY